MELSFMVCADCFGLRTQLVIAIQEIGRAHV